MKKSLALVALAFTAAAHAAPCDLSKFVIVQHHSRVEGLQMKIVGQVRNDNPNACGVKLQVSFFKGDELVTTLDGWANGTTNIAPGATFNFSYAVYTGTVAAAKKYSVGVIDATDWSFVDKFRR